MEHVVIVGNGIAGVTAARHIRKNSDKKITIISAESEHFFSRTALMYVYMGHMRWQDLKPYEDKFWDKNRIDLVQAYVEKIDSQDQILHMADGQTLNYDTLILATGSVPAKYGWEGQDLEGVQGLVSKQDLELLEKNAPNNEVCPKAVIVGGGLIGVELAEMLYTRKIDVTILVREKGFWSGILPDAEAQLISEHIQSHGIDLRHEEELDKIIADGNGKVKAIITKKGEEIPCNLVGITTGVKPKIDFLEGSGIETDKGILVNKLLETNIQNVYAIGDCAQQREAIDLRKPVEAVWYTGRMMGETVAQTICGTPFEYNPGNWFNSAKFFDIEYQTYGWVFSSRNKKDYEQHFHWKHPDNTKCITIAFHKKSLQFLGINTFGIRMRHEVLDRWLNERKSIDYVLQHLSQANFDPEFYKKYESYIQATYKASKQTA
ncbi:NAD(P)/FAD-dependent oxidoreductase [Leeuwenhoekiella marinoflava]|uniref:Pyridine nucleotide-disulfide oxidoreductase n=2 Tax=Leeuwenhoekiella marinoflava TaxID=988 RepID=A0A4Q0PJ56_9FLAO|nr:NAD(P)/FAD-dependent oxidoreductase [Leeuwenhoekiella marinoflava]RXG27387.1 pyridine nucleotide-disulfide oxidoreductase [Leeuwenhoekiella marinoflava]SHF70542.1 Pyridine nucleotide-disulphide oxidoreductase [Leeuwenhoekiella marinoflava DSM 3653]